jgi:hypothetical protein
MSAAIECDLNRFWGMTVRGLGLGRLSTLTTWRGVVVGIVPVRYAHRRHYYILVTQRDLDAADSPSRHLDERMEELIGRAWFDQPYLGVEV